ncbi:hypothetical protein TNCV_40351 [Trichonephila clavipes]|nr:hypothetical protein TNCV_40351 [Trichonephila clavipes]
MCSEVPVDRWDGVDGLQFIGQAHPPHALLYSSTVSMLANPYREYPPIEGIRLQCLHGEDGRCHPYTEIPHPWRPDTNLRVVTEWYPDRCGLSSLHSELAGQFWNQE